MLIPLRHGLRAVVAVAAALFLGGCSLITIDFTPRIRPLEEEGGGDRDDGAETVAEGDEHGISARGTPG